MLEDKRLNDEDQPSNMEEQDNNPDKKNEAIA